MSKPRLGNWGDDPRMQCSICHAPLQGRDSHNAMPVNNGRCCGKCNAKRVIPARLETLRREGRASILGFSLDELKAMRPAVKLADKRDLLSSASDLNMSTDAFRYQSKETGEALGIASPAQFAKDMAFTAKRRYAEEHKPKSTKTESLNEETAARSKAEFYQWLEGPIELERVHHSIAHRITPDNLPVQAHILLVNHDWASLLHNSDTSGPSGSATVRLPYPISVFEFLFKGGVHAVCVAIQLDSTNDEDITATTHFKTKSGWVKAEIEVTYDEHGNLKAPHNFQPSNPLIKAYTIITKNVFAVSVMLEAQVAEATPIRADYKRNIPRREGLKPPELSHHVVSLAVRHRTSRTGFPSEERRHPRLHFRRGHWRHFASHKTWIRWMLVGDPELGFVDKDYSL